MTFPEFDKFFDEFVAECRNMRDKKGKEYANSENRFDNFNRLAKEIGISNSQIGWVYARKHIDSIQQYLRTGKIYSTERVRGRFIDAVTYFILIAGMEAEKPEEKYEPVMTNAVNNVKDTSALRFNIESNCCFYGLDYPCHKSHLIHTYCDYTGLVTPKTKILRG